ncbi:MAG TPA: 1,4-dihydroxy-2-naphthoate polyprenyltransferase [Longimicrobiales bacterium]|nr:1,4-dihydroxy-2-naphthoate polyprenyltransferase [Longimicrobiales bacterium]
MTSPWILAARPKTLPAAAAPVLVGMALAWRAGGFALLPALAALAGAVLIQVATNLANDYFDFIHGADTEHRVGPTRVTQAGLLSPVAVRNGMGLTLLAALLVGIYLVWVAGTPILWIGLAALVCAVAYTGGPFPLAYRGLGDLFVFVFFGLVAVTGTVYVQTLAFSWEALWAGAGVGAVSTCLLVVNNLRDIRTDEKAGKRTLAVRVGVTGTRVEYTLLWAFAIGVPIIGIGVHGWPSLVVLAVLGLVAAGSAVRAVWTFRRPEELLPALPATSAGLLVYALGLSAGLVLG